MEAGKRDVRCKLLAEALPATSFATGANEISVRFSKNIDMMEEFKNGWPLAERNNNPNWLHSDFRDVAYFYNWKLYDDICGGLK